MRTDQSNIDKLVPLRKFAKPGVYSPAYLSQLVQRKKLKAKRIGRNYFTCERWFNKYLERHARDEKQVKYNKRQLNSSWKQIAISVAVFLLFLVIGFGWYISYNRGRIAGAEEQYNQSADETQTLRGFNKE